MLKKAKNLWFVAAILLFAQEAMNQFFISFSGTTDSSTKVFLRVGDALIGILLLLGFAAVPAALLALVPFGNKTYGVKFRYLLPLVACVLGLFLCAFNIYRLYLKSKGEYLEVYRP